MKHLLLRCGILAAVGCGLASPAAAGNLRIWMQAGRVTIIADDVPLRQIMQEWARVGQTTVLNADKLSGPAITLQLTNVPERDALDIILRSASGYIAAPRPVAIAGASSYDRVTIMATSHAPAASAVSAAAPPPTFQRQPTPMDEGDEPINVAMPQPPLNSPAVGQFPMPQNGTPAGVQPNPTQATPGAPLTAPRPGALPMPSQPGVPNPYQPAKPGGGGPGGPGVN